MKNKQGTIKYWVGQVHLWLGFASGIIVFILSITGCIYAFQEEIKSVVQTYRYAEAENKPVLMPSELKEIAEKALPDKKIHGIGYTQPGRSSMVSFYNFEPEYYYIVYINPYSGEVLKVNDENADFFRWILMGHFYLWLPPEIGQTVVASATLVFFFMLVTGLVLWWPKNKKAAKQRFTIKWDARWRRKNYDLHNVLGFYATWIAIILAVTGLVFGFQWFAKGVYMIAGGEKSLEFTAPVSDTTKVLQGDMPAYDQLYLKMRAANPQAKMLEVHVPETADASIEVSINPDDKTYWQADYRYFDQYTLEEVQVDHIYGRSQNASVADNLIRMNYDIHTGAVIGLPGKILAFFASLICASLPVTGFYIWWGRRNKEEKTVAKRPGAKVVQQQVAFGRDGR